MLANQRGGEVVEWLGHIDPAVKETRPDILALEASAMAMSGRVEGLDAVLRMLDASSSATRADRLIATVARSYAQLSRGASVDALASAGHALSDLRSLGDQDLPRWFRLTGSTADVAASAEIAKGLSHLCLADLGGARRALRDVPTESHAMWRSSAQGFLALCDALGARLSAADHCANRAFAIGAEPGGRDLPLVPAMLARALVASERDEVERALDLLADAESAVEGSDRPLFSRWVAIERARLALAGGAPPQAMKILADEVGAGVQAPPLIATRTAVATARALIATGDLPAAARTIDRVRDFEGHEVFATRVRVLVESGDLPGARTLLKRWPDDTEPRGRLERTLWAAILSDAEGDTPAAVAAMSATVAECEIEGFLGLFRDAGPPALALARAVYRTAPSAFLRQVVERPVVPFHPRHPKGLIVPLTDREYAVLALLPTRLSYGEIADRLGISRNTVKTHLKHIYHKFNAVRRSEAISAAERLHLL
jgi:LuxR family maltose regulon positive regulatory protein